MQCRHNAILLLVWQAQSQCHRVIGVREYTASVLLLAISIVGYLFFGFLVSISMSNPVVPTLQTADGQTITRSIADDLAGSRLDKALAMTFPEFSRARLQKWLQEGALQVSSGICKQKDKVWGGEIIRLQPEVELDDTVLAEDIPLDIVFADEHLLVVNKPAGLVVHPGAGNWTGTLQNGLLHYDGKLAAVPRAGIVHRLDKDTTGLMVVARTIEAQTALVRALKARDITREYEAIVRGVVTAGGTIETSMGRHPKDRLKMAVVSETSTGARHAMTHYRVLEKFSDYTHLHMKLETGRTHQIRVHLAHINYPIIGDGLYGGRSLPAKGLAADLRDQLQQFDRQALHAKRLALQHPITGEALEWHAPRPADMQALLAALQQHQLLGDSD